MPVVTEDELPVLYLDWAEWRIEQTSMSMTPLVESGTFFCVTCAGNGRIYEAAGNGEGLIPTPCLSCLGRGTVGP